MKGRVFVLPMVITEEDGQSSLSPALIEAIRGIHHYACENVRTARRFVSSLKVHADISALQFNTIPAESSTIEIHELLAPARNGHDLGILSESGCPGVADPGSVLVELAHSEGIQVVPVTGPSSILLGLMASGLNGQQFAFHGYLPVDATEAVNRIVVLEKESKQRHQTQIFIETPYRNNALLGHLLKSLHPTTRLCVAIDLTGKSEQIISRPVGAWKKDVPTLPKSPAIFLFLAH